MNKEALTVGVGSEAKFSNGSLLRVTILKPKRHGVASSTAIHEAMHAVVAKRRGLSVKTATVRPGPGYLGMVDTGAYDAPTFMAPAAMGCDGGGHDEAVVEYFGDSKSAAASVGRSIVNENPHEVAAVANLLDEKGTVGDGEIQTRMNEVRDDVVLGENVIVTIIHPNGRREDRIERAKAVVVINETEDDSPFARAA